MENLVCWFILICFGRVLGTSSLLSWIPVKSTNVTIVDSKLDFWSANQFCQKNNKSYLLTVISETFYDELSQKLLEKNINESWVGLTDFGDENKFYSILNYTNPINYWEDGYPKDNRRASDCVLAKRNADKYKWVDVHCAEKHSFICIKNDSNDFQLKEAFPPHSNKLNECPKTFFRIDGDCFWISSDNVTWNKGRSICHSKHPESDLASIRSIYQQEYFSALISENSTDLWIGLNSYANQDQWILQHKIAFTNWAKVEHSDPKKVCTYMSGKTQELGKWHKSTCTKKLKVICQTLKTDKPAQSNDPHSAESKYDDVLFQKRDCAKYGHYYYEGSCYIPLNMTADTQAKALESCTKETFFNKSSYKFEVNLVHFDNLGEKYFILSNLRRSFSNLSDDGLWLNVSGIKTENKTVLRIEILNNIQVPDFEYSLNSINKLEKICFKLLLNGSVHMSSCTKNTVPMVMCRYKIHHLNVKDVHSNKSIASSCFEPWEIFQSVCFLFDKHIYQSQYEARKACMKLGAHLPSIDAHQQQFLKDFISRKSKLLKKDLNSWIGLEIYRTSDENIKYQWMNDATMSYVNIELPQLIFQKNNVSTWCTHFSSDNGLWKVVNCTEANATLICQKPANLTILENVITTTPHITEQETTAKSISNFISKPGLKFFNTRATWFDSLKTCKSQAVSDGYTANLINLMQYSDVLKIISNPPYPFSQSEYWIGLTGLYDNFDNAFVRWSDNSPMVFQNFDYNNLMNLTGNENCAVMNIISGKWLAINCYEKRPYICEISKKNPEDIPQWKPFFSQRNLATFSTCPENFVEHLEKCYHVVEDKMLNSSFADNYCHTTLGSKLSNPVQLAEIDNTFENSFVYSLLSANINPNNDTRYWIASRYTSDSDPRQLCTAMSGHPDPYIGARWFTENCSTRLKFICMSWKTKSNLKPKKNKVCKTGDHEYENAMGTSCYYFHTHLNHRKDSQHRCVLDTPMGHLLTIQSHYHMHFLRNQIEVYGFSQDQAIWLGAKIPANETQHSWKWDNNKPIRYTIWNKPPVLDTYLSRDLCFYFLMKLDQHKRLGMQVEMCNDENHNKKYFICEYIVPNNNRKGLVNGLNNSNCLSDTHGSSYQGTLKNTLTGKRCIRWDLLKPSTKLSQIISSIRTDPDKLQYIQYHSNECRFIKGMDTQTTFCAHHNDLSNQYSSLEECAVQLCRLDVSTTLVHDTDFQDSHSNTLTVVLVTLVLFLCIVICIALLSWQRWNKGALFDGYLRRNHFSFLHNQSRGTSFNNPIYRPINT